MRFWNCNASVDSLSFRPTVSSGRPPISTSFRWFRAPAVPDCWKWVGETRHCGANMGSILDLVTVATAPENYESRLIALYPDRWKWLRLFALEAHDLALTKLERNFERDRADVAHLARSGWLDGRILRQRYHDESRPYLTGRETWHDQTLELWLEEYLSIVCGFIVLSPAPGFGGSRPGDTDAPDYADEHG